MTMFDPSSLGNTVPDHLRVRDIEEALMTIDAIVSEPQLPILDGHYVFLSRTIMDKLCEESLYIGIPASMGGCHLAMDALRERYVHGTPLDAIDRDLIDNLKRVLRKLPVVGVDLGDAHWRIEGAQMAFFEDDGKTEIARFSLSEKSGAV